MSVSPGTLRLGPLRIAATHPALAGHFPGRPIVPGALLLDEVLHAIESDHAQRLGGWQLQSAKFHRGLLPEQSFVLEVNYADGPCSFRVRSGGQLILSGSVLLRDASRTHTASPPAAVPPTTSPTTSSAADWRTYRERGSRLSLRWMAAGSLRAGRPLSRCVLHAIALYYFLFAPRARSWMLQYLRRVLGRRPRGRERLRLIMSFATSIHDRLFLLAGRDELFDISLQGEDVVRAAIASGGAFLMGAHVGSFEILRLIGRRKSGFTVAMAMYEENARKLNAIMGAAATEPPEIIAVGRVDSMLRIQACLEQGHLVGVLADRRFGAERSLAVNFLGAPALFPTNPMRLAAALGRRVIFMLGLYRGANRYHVVFEPLADFSLTPPAERQAAIDAAVRRYVALLELHCRTDPYNWFNFFDFWGTGHGEAIQPARATR